MMKLVSTGFKTNQGKGIPLRKRMAQYVYGILSMQLYWVEKCRYR